VLLLAGGQTQRRQRTRANKRIGRDGRRRSRRHRRKRDEAGHREEKASGRLFVKRGEEEVEVRKSRNGWGSSHLGFRG
jgi:hypothetical protein